MRILVAGVGNVFLGDDGFGVAVARRLAEADLPPGVEAGDFGIRGVHLAYELTSGYDLAILVDAAPRGRPPGTLYVLEPSPGETGETGETTGAFVDGHAMTPEAVITLARALGHPGTGVLVVGCEPADTSPGMDLSLPVAGAVEPAAGLVLELIEQRRRADAPVAAGHEEETRC
ncbi:hydrogenase maturation protease [Microbispora sp. NPDC049125]|uniref:hydrogenase maturation protease n=1 Tax=Microbispora sp. NPDC049125 TaxID=3154929 RepID=UPI003464FF30